jgi:hypothetical protein
VPNYFFNAFDSYMFIDVSQDMQKSLVFEKQIAGPNEIVKVGVPSEQIVFH